MTVGRSHFVPIFSTFALAFAFATTVASACNEPHCGTQTTHAAAHASLARNSAVAPASVATVVTTARNAVAIRNFAFEPAVLTVTAGSKVTWANRDEEPHLVVSAGAKFPASPALDTDDSYAAVFDQPGTYTYFCALHPHMVGTIIVTATVPPN
jgi:plastocyanin